MGASGRRLDVGAIILGGIVLFVGVFYLLKNTFGWDIGEIDWDMVWPFIVILIGGSIVAGGFRLSRHEDNPKS